MQFADNSRHDNRELEVYISLISPKVQGLIYYSHNHIILFRVLAKKLFPISVM